MAFLGSQGLISEIKEKGAVSPFVEENVKNGAYELTLGDEVFQTDSSPRRVKKLANQEQIEIKPGQFALLLTQEYVRIPNDKIAFISIKAGIKFKGLVNVSGFHVDPGFEGKLLFSVYNAGPSSIVLSSGSRYFQLWFADLNEIQDYKGAHDKQTRIPDGPVESLSQGELASPSVLSKRIDETKHLQTKIEWAVLAILGFAIAFAVKTCSDSKDLSRAVEYGYQQRSSEVRGDSLSQGIAAENRLLLDKIDSLRNSQAQLAHKVDSLAKLIKGKKR